MEFGGRDEARAWAMGLGDSYGHDGIVVEAADEASALALARLWDDGVLDGPSGPIDALGPDRWAAAR